MVRKWDKLKLPPEKSAIVATIVNFLGRAIDRAARTLSRPTPDSGHVVPMAMGRVSATEPEDVAKQWKEMGPWREEIKKLYDKSSVLDEKHRELFVGWLFERFHKLGKSQQSVWRQKSLHFGQLNICGNNSGARQDTVRLVIMAMPLSPVKDEQNGPGRIAILTDEELDVARLRTISPHVGGTGDLLLRPLGTERGHGGGDEPSIATQAARVLVGALRQSFPETRDDVRAVVAFNAGKMTEAEWLTGRVQGEPAHHGGQPGANSSNLAKKYQKQKGRNKKK
ncbi:hypothetical protein GGTG_05051 [Gaeumannomyces tritici R3-111a-1]|uniref:Uncharacterized protein n=1 Tax=Gaeumannomyces tritici (strain R3-111a-1) TaxID=644352 RepID=J3NUU5_GAET3|nr:hypothetical protein GGTG_05051 [Gaeumannomyces tritici R3-111a-1]EJT79969.1 hypothetical protein GGTG_05051 [Gaeumannomyces tritici R3-111a-1]